MASDTDWRKGLTSSDRYDNIQALQAGLEAAGVSPCEAQKQAFILETEMYKASSSRDNYDVACSSASQSSTASGYRWQKQVTISDNPSAPPITIGPYRDCQYIAEGVTAQVYRSSDKALKVIVQTRNIDPHDPHREVQILRLLREPCIPLIEVFKDQEQRLVLVFPYMPLTLQHLMESGDMPIYRVKKHFKDLFTALQYLHEQGIIHRDIKPSALLLHSVDGPALLSDFGTAWHPELSISTEPANRKVLDVGTGPYRSPEALFGDRSYDTGIDMWAAGVMLAECYQMPPKPLFESRPAYEDGNQLGLILSIFKTIGSPTPDSWPEAQALKTPPFEMYQTFDGQSWTDLLPGPEEDLRKLVASLVKYSAGARASADQALQSRFFSDLNPVPSP